MNIAWALGCCTGTFLLSVIVNEWRCRRHRKGELKDLEAFRASLLDEVSCRNRNHSAAIEHMLDQLRQDRPIEELLVQLVQSIGPVGGELTEEQAKVIKQEVSDRMKNLTRSYVGKGGPLHGRMANLVTQGVLAATSNGSH